MNERNQSLGFMSRWETKAAVSEKLSHLFKLGNGKKIHTHDSEIAV